MVNTIWINYLQCNCNENHSFLSYSFRNAQPYTPLSGETFPNIDEDRQANEENIVNQINNLLDS